jgi:hypothetical protein
MLVRPKQPPLGLAMMRAFQSVGVEVTLQPDQADVVIQKVGIRKLIHLAGFDTLHDNYT